MKKLLLAVLLFAAPAFGQSVQQSGNVTPGHASCWTTNGIVQDCGTAQFPALTSLGLVGQGNTFCLNSAPVTGAYNQLCFAVNNASQAQLTLEAFGGATAQNLQFVINGTTYDFPLSLSGVLGPNSSTIGNTTCWNNTQGSLLKDCGWTATAPASANAIPYWTSTTALGSFAAVNNAVVSTNGSGVPSESTTLPSALTIPSPTVSGTLAGSITVPGTNTYSGVSSFTNATASTTTGTGAVVVTGGVGIGGDVFVGGTAHGITLTNNQNATSAINVNNTNTGASAAAQTSLATGTANSSWTRTLTDNASPTAVDDTGSAVTSITEKMNGTAILTKTKGGGVQFGAPTGGDKGAGAINTQSFYINGNQFLATAPTIQSFTSGSGTYNLPAGVKWIRVRGVGGGGGGAGSGSSTTPTGTTGGNTTFGTTLLVGNGGVGGSGTTASNSVVAGGAGGTASLGAANGLAFSGQNGTNGVVVTNAGHNSTIGGAGGNCPLFGGGGPQINGVDGGANTGNAGITNSGGGGSGSTGSGAAAGGGAGGCFDAIITSPSSTYSYAVGGSGAGGIGTGATAATGGAGAAGILIVEEHYNY